MNLRQKMTATDKDTQAGASPVAVAAAEETMVAGPVGLRSAAAARSAETVYGSAQTQTAEFKAWFGASKVLDASGAPLRVFHGTLAMGQDATAFKVADSFGHGFLGEGVWFTDDPADASKYASEDPSVNHDLVAKAEVLERKNKRFGLHYRDAKAMLMGPGRVVPVYLRMERPLEVGSAKLEVPDAMWRLAAAECDITDEVRDRMLPLFRKKATGVEQFEVLTHNGASRMLRQIASLMNCDGVILRPEAAPKGKGAAHYLILNASQAKSAVGNCGAFDSTNPDLCS